MLTQHAAEIHKAVCDDQALQLKQAALQRPRRFIKLAAKQGYRFTKAELKTAIEQLSPAELAALFNPGIGTRHSLIPR